MTSKGTKRSLFSFGSKSHWVVRLIFPEFFLSWKNTGHFPWNEFTAGFSQLPEEKWWCGAVKSRGRQPSNPKDPTPSWKCFREITSWNPNCCAFLNIFMARFKKKNAEKETKNYPCTSLFTHKATFLIFFWQNSWIFVKLYYTDLPEISGNPAEKPNRSTPPVKGFGF